MKRKSKTKRKNVSVQPEDNGFRWEEWRDGKLVMSGAHNGSTLDGKDATWQTMSPGFAISYKALEAALYGKK